MSKFKVVIKIYVFLFYFILFWLNCQVKGENINRLLMYKKGRDGQKICLGQSGPFFINLIHLRSI